MNSKIRIALAGAACVLGSAMMFAQSPGGAAPAADNPMPGAAPAQGYVWMSGHWDSENGQWKWVAAHWEQPPSRSAVWVAGHWVPSGSGWAWVNGAWNVSDAPQGQSGPPQPPGQGVATPSSPAPYVDGQYQGQYGPGGVVRSADQAPVVQADYGTVDYSASYYPYAYPGYVYPSYGWVGDPWYWGYPGVALGFGFGGIYGGWGHGYGFGGRGYGGRGFGGHGGYGGHGFGGHH
jgi:hypothetical protein